MNPIIKKIKEVQFLFMLQKKTYKKTEGCVALKKIQIKNFKNIKKKTKVKIVNQK
jgi:L,D-peptidoglycan transpeptidase YkuD (ErfK/YbiS/YcfS/YnhG family)